MAARFRIDQVSPGQGVLDRSRHDLVAGEIITLVVPSPVSGATYTWELIDKVGSTAELSASSGTTVSIGDASAIVEYSGFMIQLTETIGTTTRTSKRLASVPSATAGLRPPLFGETSNIANTLEDNDPDASTDNATYADRAGLGISEQNWRGWAELLYKYGLAVEEALTAATAAAGLGSAAPENVTKSAASAGASGLAARADHKHDVTTAAPSTIGTANSEGSASSLARSDHVHNHGVQTDTTLHALVTSSAHGFMSSTDKAKIDTLANTLSFVTVAGTTKTLALSDATTVQECTSASNTTITVPPSSSVSWALGTVISIIAEGGGQVTVAAGAGVTLKSRNSEFKTAGTEAEIFLKYRGSNVWHITGDKTA